MFIDTTTMFRQLDMLLVQSSSNRSGLVSLVVYHHQCIDMHTDLHNPYNTILHMRVVHIQSVNHSEKYRYWYVSDSRYLHPPYYSVVQHQNNTLHSNIRFSVDYQYTFEVDRDDLHMERGMDDRTDTNDCYNMLYEPPYNVVNN